MTTGHLSSSILRDNFAQVRAGLRGHKVSRKNLPIQPTKKKKKNLFVPLFILGLGLFCGLVTFAPQAYYNIFPKEVVPVISQDKGTPLGGDFSATPSAEVRVLPPYDESLPEGEWIIIPRIGVRTELRKTEDSEEALKQGVWWVPDFGSPLDTELPMIVVAHRFGYQWWWKSDYWKYNSFYLLPELEPGDLVEVIIDHRKWTYEIYAGEEGTEITDYQAHLILYTCKYLNSPVRHFRYARLIDTTKNTQNVL